MVSPVFLLTSAADGAKVQVSNIDSTERLVETKWGITRTQFAKGTHSTNSESFQEAWHLKKVGEKIFLTSPRAKIELTGLSLRGEQTIESMKLTRKQLFELLGVRIDPETMEVSETEAKITFDHKAGVGTSKTLSFNLANEEQLQIDLTIESQTP
jgi:hypothetical protein